MGGNLVALQEEPSGAYDNPAALGALDQYLVSARYAQLFAGLENDDLSAGGLEAMAPLGGLGGMELAWDHFSGDFLQQDRFQLAWGREQDPAAFGRWDLGLSLGYLRQAYTLSAPLAGVSTNQLSAQAFALGVGSAWKPWPWLVLGFSGQDINQPNLGVLGPAQVPATWRWGLALRSGAGALGAAEITAAQSLSLGQNQTQVGAQWEPWNLGLALRAGLAPNEGSVGLGWALGTLRLDYAYLFSIGADASLGGSSLPANHWFELSYAWGAGTQAGSWLDKARDAGRRGDWAQAVWYYGNALESHPADPAVGRERDQATAQYQSLRSRQYYQAGIKAQALGNLAEARIDFQWARQARPADPLPAAALAALDAQMPKGALADPRSRRPWQSPWPCSPRGRSAAALARLDQALAWYPGDASLAALRKVYQAQAQAEAGPAPLSAGVREAGAGAAARGGKLRKPGARRPGAEGLAEDLGRGPGQPRGPRPAPSPPGPNRPAPAPPSASAPRSSSTAGWEPMKAATSTGPSRTGNRPSRPIRTI